MTPIKNLTNQLRMPRLGKIHLGYRDEKKKGAPTATDYFVCPPEVTAVFGEKPKSLPIYIPVEDAEYWASQYYRAYSNTRGLICKGDGETCQRMIDVGTNDIAGKDTTKIAWEPMACTGRECPLYKSKKCGEMMCLQFMLPDVPGIGVWQIDTGSINSIRNINSEAQIIRQLCGRINMLPLLLTLEPGEISDRETGKKRMHYFLHLRERAKLQDLLADSRKTAYELLAPPVDESQAARDIEELWGDGKPDNKPKPLQEAPGKKAVETETSGNLPDKTTALAEKHKNSVAPEPAAPGPVQPAAQLDFDPEWLNETLKKIKWTEKTTKDYLKNVMKSPLPRTTSISEMVAAMSREDREDFFKKLGNLAEIA